MNKLIKKFVTTLSDFKFEKYSTKLSIFSTIVSLIVGGIVCYDFFAKTPQQILAERGIPWNTESFVQIVEQGDIENITLFLKGGMLPTTRHQKTSVILYGMQRNLDNNPVEILDLFLEHGYDINTVLIDTQFIPKYFSVDQMLRLGDGKIYRDNLLTWATRRAAWAGPRAPDLEIIEYLLSKGADKSDTLNYIKEFTLE